MNGMRGRSPGPAAGKLRSVSNPDSMPAESGSDDRLAEYEVDSPASLELGEPQGDSVFLDDAERDGVTVFDLGLRGHRPARRGRSRTGTIGSRGKGRVAST